MWITQRREPRTSKISVSEGVLSRSQAQNREEHTVERPEVWRVKASLDNITVCRINLYPTAQNQVA